MLNTFLTGRHGEQLALAYLQSQGYEILAQNWRAARFEIDLLASKGSVLHVVEVKYRKSLRYGLPETAVTKKKIKFLMCAAAAYLATHPWSQVQIDILSIFENQTEITYEWIEDVSI